MASAECNALADRIRNEILQPFRGMSFLGESFSNEASQLEESRPQKRRRTTKDQLAQDDTQSPLVATNHDLSSQPSESTEETLRSRESILLIDSQSQAANQVGGFSGQEIASSTSIVCETGTLNMPMSAQVSEEYHMPNPSNTSTLTSAILRSNNLDQMNCSLQQITSSNDQASSLVSGIEARTWMNPDVGATSQDRSSLLHDPLQYEPGLPGEFLSWEVERVDQQNPLPGDWSSSSVLWPSRDTESGSPVISSTYPTVFTNNFTPRYSVPSAGVEYRNFSYLGEPLSWGDTTEHQ